MPPPPPLNQEEIEHRFNAHALDEDQAALVAQVRQAVKTCATLFALLIPEGREKSTAVTKLEEAAFWANAGISRSVT